MQRTDYTGRFGVASERTLVRSILADLRGLLAVRVAGAAPAAWTAAQEFFSEALRCAAPGFEVAAVFGLFAAVHAAKADNKLDVCLCLCLRFCLFGFWLGCFFLFFFKLFLFFIL